MPGPRVAKIFPARPPFTLSSIPDLTGKVALVTGGTSGIGLETARILAHAGARVYITSRSDARAQDAINDIVNNGPDKNRIGTLKVDVRAIQLDLDDVKTVGTVAAATLLRDIPALDILVANAGYITRELKFTVDGIESQFAVSHVAHFVLILTLLPAVEAARSKTGDARIVIVSSHGQCDAPAATGIDFDSLTNTGKDDGLSWRQRYGQTKLAGMLFMHSLSQRVSANVRVNACHPGAVISRFNDGLFANGNESWSLRFQLAIFKKFFMVPPATAALGTVVYLATAEKIRDDDARAGYFWPVAKRMDDWASKWALDARLRDEMWEFTVRIVKRAGLDIE
ncbi:hypothetical protein V1509DRAFT_662818 [Lipomyces kononenkoae]